MECSLLILATVHQNNYHLASQLTVIVALYKSARSIATCSKTTIIGKLLSITQSALKLSIVIVYLRLDRINSSSDSELLQVYC